VYGNFDYFKQAINLKMKQCCFQITCSDDRAAGEERRGEERRKLCVDIN
jgi:hypothetical protein